MAAELDVMLDGSPERLLDLKAPGMGSVTEKIKEIETDISSVKDNLETIENGVSENATVGNALQLASNNVVEDQVPYLFRKTGGNKEAGNRAYIDKIVGGTVVWNQYVLRLTSENWQNESGVTATYTDNVATISSTTANNGIRRSAGIVQKQNHIYLGTFACMGTSGYTVTFVLPATSSVFRFNHTISATNTWETTARVVKATTDASLNYMYLFCNTTYTDLSLKDVMLFDLTTMFGSTIADYIFSLEQASAGSGIAKLREWGFDFDTYHEYDPGTLKSVEGLQSHDTVGFNQWDEKWELGSFNTSTGEKTSSTTRIRSKYPIKVLQSNYYFMIANYSLGSIGIELYFYDEDGNFISYIKKWSANLSATNIPSGARYMHFCLHPNYGVIYKNDICINLSDPSKNGQYEPYKKRSYPLDSTLTLRGIPKLDANNELYFDGDEYSADGVNRRFKIVTYNGSENWTKEEDSSQYHRFYIADNSVIRTYDYRENIFATIPVLPASNLQTITTTETLCITAYGANIGTNAGKNWIYMMNPIDGTIDTVDKLKAYLAGHPVTAILELATPTTEEAEPYQTPQIVDEYGTEEFVSTSIVPIGHVTRYPTNQVRKLDGLPSNFSTLIAPTEKTTTASQNYAVGSYLILNNQLYKVTSAIASGATITPGTNVTATTIMTEILALA